MPPSAQLASTAAGARTWGSTSIAKDGRCLLPKEPPATIESQSAPARDAPTCATISPSTQTDRIPAGASAGAQLVGETLYRLCASGPSLPSEAGGPVVWWLLDQRQVSGAAWHALQSRCVACGDQVFSMAGAPRDGCFPVSCWCESGFRITPRRRLILRPREPFRGVYVLVGPTNFCPDEHTLCQPTHTIGAGHRRDGLVVACVARRFGTARCPGASVASASCVGPCASDAAHAATSGCELPACATGGLRGLGVARGSLVVAALAFG